MYNKFNYFNRNLANIFSPDTQTLCYPELYYYDLWGHFQENINRIILAMETHLNYLFCELERYGICKFTIHYLFRFITSFVIGNYQNYPGTPDQRTTALLNALHTQHPWVFFMMSAFGIPAERVNQIVRIVIAFTLANILPETLPPEEVPPEEIPPEEEFPPEEELPPGTSLEQQADRILAIIIADTNIIPTLEDYGVPINRVPEIVRTVILFTLRNINLTQPPTNIEQTATNILERLRTTNPELIRELRNYGVPNNQIRTILREIILITLENVEPIPVLDQPDIIEQEVIRITDLIRVETNIFTDLERFGIPVERVTQIVSSVVLFTLRSINFDQPPADIDREATRILRNLRNADPELIANLRNYGIPQNQINAILKGIILYTLGATYSI